MRALFHNSSYLRRYEGDFCFTDELGLLALLLEDCGRIVEIAEASDELRWTVHSCRVLLDKAFHEQVSLCCSAPLTGDEVEFIPEPPECRRLSSDEAVGLFEDDTDVIGHLAAAFRLGRAAGGS